MLVAWTLVVGKCRWSLGGVTSSGALLLAACGGDDVGRAAVEPAGEAAVERPIQLNGAVQKGPLSVGSSILVANLDLDLNPTGAVFSTYTRDDQGRFEVEMTASDLVSIEGTGYYYNEASGGLSQGPITLRALHGVGAGRADDAFVNVVTHLTYERVRALILGALGYDDARVQAEQELQTALGITVPGFVVGAAGPELNLLGGDSDANAYLFAVSALLTRAARLQSPSAPDAALSELLNQLAFDLAATGTIDAGRGAQLAAALAALPVGAIESAFAARYPSAVVPDLDRVLDQDADGLVNAADNCATVPNALQEDADLDGHGDACDDDSDGDGTPDASDSLPNDPNEWTDADGVNDAIDNCLALDNADQLDTDGDLIGDACDPDAPTACTAQTQGLLQCADENIEFCSLGLWSVVQTCDFWCSAGACISCDPGATFCDLSGPGTNPTVWVCDDSAQLRKFVSATIVQTCLPPDFPTDTSSLPADTNPPRWVRVVGSR